MVQPVLSDTNQRQPHRRSDTRHRVPVTAAWCCQGLQGKNWQKVSTAVAVK